MNKHLISFNLTVTAPEMPQHQREQLQADIEQLLDRLRVGIEGAIIAHAEQDLEAGTARNIDLYIERN